jgi:hypothetical protein
MKCGDHPDREAAGYIVKNEIKIYLCRECLNKAVLAGEVVSHD